MQLLTKILKSTAWSAIALAVSAVLAAGCAQEQLPDNRETEYGYVQFRLYKAASLDAAATAAADEAAGAGTKAVTDCLDYLGDACKVRVEIISGEQTIAQTLTLESADAAGAEFGLRSTKLRLLAGDYQVAAFTLYDTLDEELYIGSSVGSFTVVPGGLSTYDLAANTTERGFVRFSLAKDMSSLTGAPGSAGAQTKASTVSREYTFDEISTVDLTLVNMSNSADRPTFTGLEATFSEYFEGDEHHDGETGAQGWQTSGIVCDTLVSVRGGTYKVASYTVYDSNGTLLETFTYDDLSASAEFTVRDNALTEATVMVSLHEADEYLKDNYALYEIWKALGGENWSYFGQSYVRGANWDFNKDPDLWCDQPGVEVHSNGRIAKIDLSGFGIRGTLPAAIGQLTELVELALGDHNETSLAVEDPISFAQASREEKQAWRLSNHRKYMDLIHPAVQMSAPCALALKEHGISSRAASMYEKMSSDEISRMASGGGFSSPSDLRIQPYDMNHGVLTNGLVGIDPAIGKLTKLENLNIANSPITADGFPAEMVNLVSVTDIEIYNCPNLEYLPECITDLPSVVAANYSNNGFTAEGSYRSLDALATGAGGDEIQILYYLQNSLESLPLSVGGMESLGMLDLSQNNISGKIPAFGNSFAPIDLYFDYNNITGFEEGTFCRIDDLDNFSINYNQLTEFPNIFTSDTDYYMSSISVAFNQITHFPADFKGLKATTLTLSGNPLASFPSELAATDSYVEQFVASACGMDEFPEGCLNGKYTSSITVLDMTFNDLKDLPDDFSAESLPYLYGMDLSYNDFSTFPYEPLNILRLTAFAIRGQRDVNGNRCLRQWPTGLYTHTGLRGFYIGSNDLRNIVDTISYMIFYLDIADNPNITFDASDICYYWQAGAYILYYDKTQDIRNCDAMLE